MHGRGSAGIRAISIIILLSSVRSLGSAAGFTETAPFDALGLWIAVVYGLLGILSAVGLWRETTWFRQVLVAWSVAALARLALPLPTTVPVAGYLAVLLTVGVLLLATNVYARMRVEPTAR